MDYAESPRLVCPHLWTLAKKIHHIWFTGSGLEYHWVCEQCVKDFPHLPDGCLEATDEWLKTQAPECYCDGVTGQPEVLVRDSGLAVHHETWTLDLHSDTQIIDLQPCPCEPFLWYALLSSGEIRHLDVRSRNVLGSFVIQDLGFPITVETGFCISPANDYGALYEISGSNAVVFDLQSGQSLFRHNRGEYRPQNSFFPISFAIHENRTLLVIGSDWNRLDLIDAQTASILTARELPGYKQDQERPPHYLDYFHGRITLSPNCQKVIEYGWVWHPVGIIRSWDLAAWLENPWESEDGSSLQIFDYRNYYWDGPLCWIDDHTVAVWGWGGDDEWLRPAILLRNADDGQLLRWFAGPQVRQSSAWPPRQASQSLFFDDAGYLIAVCKKTGFSVWDIQTGERLLQSEPEFQPWQRHPLSKEFLTPEPTGIKISTLMPIQR